jgi:AbrB family looped-hinge helix DNA binding protein
MSTVIVGERGQITIPKEMRKRLGIAPKTPVLVEIRDEGLFIRPALTVGLRRFTDREIERMVREDTLGKGSETASSRSGKSNGFSVQQRPVYRGVDGTGEIPFGHPIRTSITRIHPTFHLPPGARGNNVQPPGEKTGGHPVLLGTIGGGRSRTRLGGRRRESTVEGVTRK